MNRKRIFAELLSPVSAAVLWLGFTPMFVIVLRPTLWEYCVFFVVDMLAILAMIPVERGIFRLLWPDTRTYFPDFDFRQYADKSTQERVELFNSMTRFPRRRALYCLLVTIVKDIPAFVVVVYYWRHTNDNFTQGAQAIALFGLMATYFYGGMYFEFHQRVSDILAQMHAEQDWTEAFREVAPVFTSQNLDVSQFLAVSAIWLFTGAAQALVVLGPQPNFAAAATEIMVVAMGGLLLFSRLWLLERDYFVGGLRGLFRALERFNPNATQRNLPLHSSPILAHFERTFNALMDRLRSNERELSHWIFSVSEQSRFRALGETSGLIVHDLGTPLQVVAFCADQLIEDPQRLNNPRYIKQLKQNVHRSLELIQSWRAYLKNQRSGDSRANVDEAFGHVLKLLATQFEPYLYNAIETRVDPELKKVEVAMPRAELIHVLVNLTTNSFNNLIQNRVQEPVINMRLIKQDREKVTFSVADNGSGLRPEFFEKLTAFQFLPQEGETSRGGMGLRLVRRLIERNGGELSAAAAEIGTDLRLTLRKTS